MQESTQFPLLFSPIQIGPVTVKNRIVFQSSCEMVIVNRHKGLLAPEESVAYYEERAKHECGWISIGSVGVHRMAAMGYPWRYTGGLYTDDHIEQYRMIARAVHKYDCRLSLQLIFMGYSNSPLIYQEPPPLYEIEGHRYPLAPSETHFVAWPGFYAKEMTLEEIEEVIESFGQAARRALEAECDAVELHAAGMYIFDQFLNPMWNKRTDRYGGTLENRCRFLIECLQRVRKYVGEKLAVGFRIIIDAMMPGGITIDEIKMAIAYIQSQVKVDFINTAMGTSPTFAFLHPSIYFPPGYQLPFASQIKDVTDIPLMVGGRLTSPHEAEDILQRGLGDMVWFSRQFFADAEFAKKAKDGRVDDIRPCNNFGWCGLRLNTGVSTTCAFNPTHGREKYWGSGTLRPAERTRSILVIGGGPAGMETARIAAERGHRVSLYEKENELGGRIFLESKLPGHETRIDAVNWYERQLKKYGVKIVTGFEINEENLDRVLELEKPDAVVLATGSVNDKSGRSGVTGYEVPGWQTGNIVDWSDLLRGRVNIEGKTVVIGNLMGDITAIAIAEWLALRGNKVHMVSPWGSNFLNFAMSIMHGAYRQRKYVEKVHTFSWFYNISGSTVTLFDPYAAGCGEIITEVIEDVGAILMWAFKSNRDLYEPLKAKVKEVHLVGECECPGGVNWLANATFCGHRLGRKL